MNPVSGGGENLCTNFPREALQAIQVRIAASLVKSVQKRTQSNRSRAWRPPGSAPAAQLGPRTYPDQPATPGARGEAVAAELEPVCPRWAGLEALGRPLGARRAPGAPVARSPEALQAIQVRIAALLVKSVQKPTQSNRSRA